MRTKRRTETLSGLRGVPIHPTPLYSILWNIYLGLLMFHLGMVHVPLHLLCGVYWILMGLGRFAEEAYRGEPQTPIYGRLRLYQWAALASILCGGCMAALGRSRPAPGLHFDALLLVPALAFGLVAGIALGVDFPNSNRRFARLA